jgi:class 3 adenylate cyclase
VTDGFRASRRTATVTVLFCDLVDSTARQTRIGDDVADEFRDRFFAALRDAVARSNGEEVKNLGDGLMVVFRHSTANAVACAEQMHRGVEALDAEDPSSLHIGISVGEAAEDGGDWFGTPVVEAARLCSAAKAGQTLANEVVRTLVGSRGGFAFRSVGRLELKGLAAPVAAVEVVRPSIVERVPEQAPSRDQRSWRRPVIIAAAVMLVVALTAAALALVVSGGTKSGKRTSAVNATQPRNYPVSYATKPCARDELRQVPGLVCGTLTVPEDRARPSGRVVKLDVRRAPARGGVHGVPTVDFGADDLATSPARDSGEEIQMSERV